MKTLKIDITKVLGFVPEENILNFQKEIDQHHKSLLNKTGKGNKFLGWVNLPEETGEDIITSILESARKIREKKIDVFIVIGIGGSYLGARAVIEALNHNFSFLVDKGNNPQIIYAGQNIGEDYLSDLLEVLEEKDYALTVISKSGTTTEPALAFRILKSHLENKYGKK
ncbi:MAG: glucose-6-phosphate isomerase, partial [Bacteroidetes bacterium]